MALVLIAACIVAGMAAPEKKPDDGILRGDGAAPASCPDKTVRTSALP